MFTAPVVEQVEMAVPASAVGAGVIVSILNEVTSAEQGEFGEALRVIITFPAKISSALGVYVHVDNEFAFAKVPVPLDVQVTPLEFVALAPAVILTAPELEHVIKSVPAATTGAKVIVIVLVDTAFAHAVFPVAVNVRILLPAAISAALGVYVHKVNELASVKVPVPFDDQIIPALLDALDPAVMFTAPVAEQVITGVPATAVGAGVIVSILVEIALGQGVLPKAVRVIVTLPAVISAAVGVYVQFVKELRFTNVPNPEEDQVIRGLFVMLAPEVILTAPEFEQVVTGFPAFAVVWLTVTV